uniref:Uncharacterized protein n=1 Tax=Graphocephala atropunctata TaxID=36148 RepID=A0A1B6KXV6_9HEMI
MREVIVFGVLCVFALVAFTEIAGVDVLDSQEIQDEGTREGQNLTSSQLKDIDYDLDTPRGPVNSSNPPTAPSPNGKGDSSVPFWRRPVPLVYLQFCGLLVGLAAMYFFGVFIGRKI